MILALVAMVGISLINYFVKLMPTGLEPKPKEKSPEGVRALFYAIEKSNLVYAQKVLEMNFDPNVQHDNGYTALAYAAMKGNGRMVELLLRNGADPTHDHQGRRHAGRAGAAPRALRNRRHPQGRPPADGRRRRACRGGAQAGVSPAADPGAAWTP